MSSTVDAVYEDGVFKPEQPVSLKDETRVHLVIENASPAAVDDDPTGGKTAESVVGFIKDAPAGKPIDRMTLVRHANEHNVPVYLTTEKEWEADLAALDAWHDHPS